MQIKFASKFAKDLKNIKDNQLLTKIKEIIFDCKNAKHLLEIKNMKKLQGWGTFYRIRVGDCRIGLEIIDNEMMFIRCLYRKDIYRYFP